MMRQAELERCKASGSYSASNRFGRYSPQHETETRGHETVPSKALGPILKAWEKILHLENFRGTSVGLNQMVPYDESLALVRRLEYASEDVLKFSLMLEGYESEKNFTERSGTFLSALMNASQDTRFIIHTSALSKRIDYLGMKNAMKGITVEGGLGDFAAEGMAGGSITVNGGVEDFAGDMMRAGIITVYGSAGEQTGDSMRGGSIVIEGDADIWAGRGMLDGRLCVRGDAIGSVGKDMQGGVLSVWGDARDGVGNNTKGGEMHFHGRLGLIGVPQKARIFHKGRELSRKELEL